jgi:hypothetical protein
MRDLGCALLPPAVLERIVGKGEQGTVRKPRFFALPSLVLQTVDDYWGDAVTIIAPPALKRTMLELLECARSSML